MKPRTRKLAALAAVVPALCAAGLAAESAAVAAPTAQAAKSCTPPKYPGSGYFTSLSVTGTSCATGSKLAKAYYSCRKANGGADGRCTKKVLKYSCTEKRSSISTEINAKVTCKKGSAKIVHSYQQNLE